MYYKNKKVHLMDEMHFFHQNLTKQFYKAQLSKPK